MADILTLLETIGDTVADDAAIKTWCQTNYSRDHNVYLGVDIQNPPLETDYPLVHIFMGSKQVGYELDTKVHVIETVYGIHKTGLTSSGKANLFEYTGVIHIEQFRKKVETAITGIWTEGTDTLRINRIDIGYDLIEFYPFFFSDASFQINEMMYQGGNVWE